MIQYQKQINGAFCWKALKKDL